MGSIIEDKKKYILSILFFALLIVLTFWLIFKDHDILSILPAVMKANPLGLLWGYSACSAIYAVRRQIFTF